MKKGTITSTVPKTLAKQYALKKRMEFLTKIVADSPEFIPEYKTSGATCCDLKANIPPNENGQRVLCIGHLETVKVDVGFSMSLPEGFEAEIRPRSSFGAKSILVPNSPGTIDSDFRGRMCVLLTNLRSAPYYIEHLDRIAQMALKPVYYFCFESVDTLDNTERGEGGFGSTGIKT
jgi:dUTP pyrophosphatase